MALYDYRCSGCGVFEGRYPMGTAPASRPCPICAGSSPRVLSAPALLSGRTPAVRAVEADRRSAHEPAVVTAPPPRPIRPTPRHDPRQARLPRP